MPGIVLSILQTLTQLYLIITLWRKDYHDLILQMRKKLSHRDTGSFVQGHKDKKWFSSLTPESPFCLSILPLACLIGTSNLQCPEWTLDILPILSSPLLLLLFKSLCCVWHFATPRTVARQSPLSMGLPRHEYWSESHLLLQGIFPTQGLNPCLLPWQVDSILLSLQGSLIFSLPSPSKKLVSF